MKRRYSGFTLLEILLVLVLISLASVAVISTLPVNAEDSAKKYAQSFYHRVQLLNEEAILSGRDYGLYIEEKKSAYNVYQLASDGWQRLSGIEIPDRTELPDGLAISLTLGGNVWADKERLFEPGSLFDEEMFAEFEEEDRLIPPQVFIVSSGEVTPFTLAVHPENRDADSDAWRIIAKENGQIVLRAPGESDDES